MPLYLMFILLPQSTHPVSHVLSLQNAQYAYTFSPLFVTDFNFYTHIYIIQFTHFFYKVLVLKKLKKETGVAWKNPTNAKKKWNLREPNSVG